MRRGKGNAMNEIGNIEIEIIVRAIRQEEFDSVEEGSSVKDLVDFAREYQGRLLQLER